MKTLLFLILIGLSVICSGQNKFGNSLIKADSVFTGIVTLENTTSSSFHFADFGTNTCKINVELNGTFTLFVDNYKISDSIVIKSGKSSTKIPVYKLLELTNERKCPMCHKGNWQERGYNSDDHGIIYSSWTCDQCDYKEIHTTRKLFIQEYSNREMYIYKR